MTPLAPALELLIESDLAFLVDSIAVLETNVALINGLIRRRASAQQRDAHRDSNDVRARQ
jgi:hypothetical protein